MGNLCGTSRQPQASAQAAIQQWRNAGFPANKQVMGMALYGWVSQSTKTVLTGASLPTENHLILTKSESESDEDMEFLNGAHPRSKDSAVAQSAAAESTAATTGGEQSSLESESVSAKAGEVTTTANLQRWWGQQVPFKTLVSSGALAKKSDGTYGGSGGFTMGWDNCSNTPYLFNNAQRTVISYDGERFVCSFFVTSVK